MSIWPQQPRRPVTIFFTFEKSWSIRRYTREGKLIKTFGEHDPNFLAQLFFEVRAELLVLPLGVTLDAIASKWCRERVHHHKGERLRIGLRFSRAVSRSGEECSDQRKRRDQSGKGMHRIGFQW